MDEFFAVNPLAMLPARPYRPALQTGRDVAQPGSASHWGCGGRRFESSRPDQLFSEKSNDLSEWLEPPVMLCARHKFAVSYKPSTNNDIGTN